MIKDEQRKTMHELLDMCIDINNTTDSELVFEYQGHTNGFQLHNASDEECEMYYSYFENWWDWRGDVERIKNIITGGKHE